MAFDFSGLQDSNVGDTFNKAIGDDIEYLLSQITDAIWLKQAPQTTKLNSKVLEKGYFSAEEPYYMVEPWKHLPGCEHLNFLPQRYLNHIIVELSHKSSIEDEVKLPQDLDPGQRGILVFQHYHGDFVKDGEVVMDLDLQRHYNCPNDTLLFRCVFKAIPSSDGKYKLQKIWDRFYLVD